MAGICFFRKFILDRNSCRTKYPRQQACSLVIKPSLASQSCSRLYAAVTPEMELCKSIRPHWRTYTGGRDTWTSLIHSAHTNPHGFLSLPHISNEAEGMKTSGLFLRTKLFSHQKKKKEKKSYKSTHDVLYTLTYPTLSARNGACWQEDRMAGTTQGWVPSPRSP